jgi:hypothetical protein
MPGDMLRGNFAASQGVTKEHARRRWNDCHFRLGLASELRLI